MNKMESFTTFFIFILQESQIVIHPTLLGQGIAKVVAVVLIRVERSREDAAQITNAAGN